MTGGTEREIGGAWDKTKGKVNEEVGKMTGNLGRELKGDAQQVKGDVEIEAGKAQKKFEKKY